MISPKRKYSILHKGESISLKEASLVAGIAESTVRSYVIDYGCKTIKDLKKRKNKPNKRSTSKFHKLQTTKGPLTFPQILAIHPHKKDISISTLRGRAARRGSNCPSLWYPKLSPLDFRKKLVEDGLEQGIVYEKPTVDNTASIQRRTCNREDGLCVHYSDCTDAICFDKMLPKRYKKDKSCYCR